MTKQIFVGSLSALLLAACSGGQHSTAPSALTPTVTTANPSASATSGPTTTGTLVIVINRSGQTASSKTRKSQFVSPSSASVGISINGGTPTYASVAISSASCTTAGITETCSIPVAAPAGADTIALSFYDGANGTGNLLGKGTGTTTVTLGTPFTVTIPISPIVASVTAGTFTYSNGSGFVTGTAGTATIALTLADPDGNVITASTTPSFANTLTLASSDPHVTITPASYTSPSQTITVSYDGSTAVAGSVTLSLNSGSTVISSNAIKIALVTQAVYVGSQDTSLIFRYAANATGAATPTLTLNGSAPQGIATDSTYEYVANENGSIAVYPLGSTGGTPVRTISGANTLMCYPEGIAVYNGTIYLADGCAGVLEWSSSASGNVAPSVQISGSATKLSNSQSIAVSSSGIYVASASSGVTVFPLTASGNIAPSLVISGGSNSFDTTFGPQGIAVDGSGNVYVSSITGPARISVFAPGQTTASYQILGNGSLCSPNGLAFDTSGLLWVANDCTPSNFTMTAYMTGAANATASPVKTIGPSPTSVNFSITGCCGYLAVDSLNRVYASNPPLNTTTQFNSSGTLLSTLTVGPSGAFSHPSQFAFDSAKNLYVANGAQNSFISVYAPGASGSATPTRTIQAPSGTFSCLSGLALDNASHLFVSQTCGGSSTASVFEFSATASGTTTPLATITGGSSGLSSPVSLAVDSSGNLYVANAGNNSVSIYNAGTFGSNVPSAVISGSNTGLATPTGVAVDSTGNVYAFSDNPTSITVYAAGKTGNVAPIRTITGSNTTFLNNTAQQGKLAVDSAGNIYVNQGTGNVLVFRASANGNVAPDISVSNSSIEGWSGIAISPTQP